MAGKIELPNINNLIERYNAGESCNSLAHELGVSKQTVARRFRTAGVIIKTNRFPTGVTLKILTTQYASGDSINALSKRHNIGRDFIVARFVEANVELRSQSEAERLKWQHLKQDPKAIERQCSAAWKATRGSKRSLETRTKFARTMQNNRTARIGIYENTLADTFSKLGFSTTQQFACGPYNLDIALNAVPISIEVFSKRPTSLHGTKYGGYGNFYKRSEYILNAGFNLIFVLLWPSHLCGFNTGILIAKHIITYANILSRNKTTHCKYGVIGGDAQPVTIKSFNLKSRSRIQGF